MSEWVKSSNGQPGHYNEELAYGVLDMIDDTTLEIASEALNEPNGTLLQRGYHEAINSLMAQADEVYRTMRE